MSVWSLMRVFSIRFRMMEAIVVVPGGAGNTLAAKAQVEYGALETQLAQRETLVQKEAGSAGQAQEAAACIVRAGLASRVGDLRDASEGLGSSIAELLGTVQQTATSAQTANQLASRHEIAASSRKIGDIIGLTKSIAFQTNILALNAAVEAAHAVDGGVRLTEEAGIAMLEVVGRAQPVGGLIGEISIASTEQSVGNRLAHVVRQFTLRATA